MIAIEKNLLRVGIVLAVCYQLTQSLISVFNDGGLTLISLNITLTVLFTFLLYLATLYRQVVALLFHLIVLVAFAFFWMNTSGIHETVPDLMCIYFGFIMVVSRGVYRVTALVLHGLLLFLLLYRSYYFTFLHQFDLETSLLQMSVEYGLIALFIAVFVSYMKRAYVKNHHKGMRRYTQLQHVEGLLVEQNEEMKSRQEAIRVINENLESLVHSRTLEVEKKNEELSEYAFINAHMLRGPLSRVIGLANLMEKDPQQYSSEQVKSIKALATEMDLLVRKINDVLN